MEYSSNDAAESQNLPIQGNCVLSATTEPLAAAAENPQEELVSTELTLSSSTRKRKADHETSLERCAQSTPRRMKKQEQEDLKKWGVSTSLKLYGPCQIKKKLTDSDLNSQSRLLVTKFWINHHVLPFLGTDRIEKIHSSNGLSVAVLDEDSNSRHDLVLKQWESTKSYVFIGKWHRDFVSRKKLKKGDVVGMYWDGIQEKFNFSLLPPTEGSLC